jgi:hypothetical protein
MAALRAGDHQGVEPPFGKVTKASAETEIFAPFDATFCRAERKAGR